MSLGRWHSAQLLKKIGATSLVNVTAFLLFESALKAEEPSVKAGKKGQRGDGS